MLKNEETLLLMLTPQKNLPLMIYHGMVSHIRKIVRVGKESIIKIVVIGSHGWVIFGGTNPKGASNFGPLPQKKRRFSEHSLSMDS